MANYGIVTNRDLKKAVLKQDWYENVYNVGKKTAVIIEDQLAGMQRMISNELIWALRTRFFSNFLSFFRLGTLW